MECGEPTNSSQSHLYQTGCLKYKGLGYTLKEKIIKILFFSETFFIDCEVFLLSYRNTNIIVAILIW